MVPDHDEAKGRAAFYPVEKFRGIPVGVRSAFVLGGAPPRAGKKPPLVVLCHGRPGIPQSELELCETLASHGFVVAAPRHDGGTSADARAGTLLPRPEDMRNRIRDAERVIDALQAGVELTGGALVVDRERTGIAGMSYGGLPVHTLAARGRVRAAVTIAGCSREIGDATLARIEVPVLLIGGGLDRSVPRQHALDRPFREIGAREKWRLEIPGATHFHFASIMVYARLLEGLGIRPEVWSKIGAGSLVRPYQAVTAPETADPDRAHEIVARACVAFLAHHVRDRAEGTAPVRESMGDFGEVELSPAK